MTRHRGRRAGYTLVEVIVVIAILAVLASLTSAAAFYAYNKVPLVRTRSELGQLEGAVEAFKLHYKVSYLPSRIRLRENTALYSPQVNPQADALDAASAAYLAKVWPRLQLGTLVDWDGDGAVNPQGPGSWDLEGDQCLVFFLGGVPARNGAGTTGFSGDPRNPASHGGLPGGGSMVQPFFEFRGERLVLLHGNRFYSYKDPYGEKPYAYFSAAQGNDYRYFRDQGGAWHSDCDTLGALPYLDANGKFHNPNSFQLISAGRDLAFGPGGTWTPQTAEGLAAAGRDDLCNFYESLLGTPPP